MNSSERRAYLAATRPLIEATIGRQLRQAEQVVDVLKITRELGRAKDDLDQAIQEEQRAAVTRALATGSPVVLEVTAAMLAPLERLWALGLHESHAELIAAGITPRRHLEAKPSTPDLDPAVAALKRRLSGLSVRLQMEHERKTAELSVHTRGAIADALAKALVNVLGARGIAADLVSPTLFSAMGQTFEENGDLVDGWSYSGVLDAGQCDECNSLEGTLYATWDDAQVDLPNGGPNPACLGGDRCRCRLVPQAAA